MKPSNHFLSLLCVLLALVLAGPAYALPSFPPVPDGPVYDGAQILPPAEEAALDAKLRDYNQRTGRALIVATVPSLQDDTVEDFAVRLFQAWGVGGKDSDSGLLLLVAPNERKVRIEVGYGLTPFVTDILSGRIIRNDITPRFKAGDLPGGIDAGIDALITQLDRDPADAKAVAEAAAAAQAQQRSDGGPNIGNVIFWIVLIVVFMAMFGGGGGGGQRRRRGFGSTVGNIILWEALGAATRGSGGHSGGFGGGGGGFGGGGGGFGGFGGGSSGGGGASGGW